MKGGTQGQRPLVSEEIFLSIPHSSLLRTNAFNQIFNSCFSVTAKEVALRCSVKKVLFKYLQILRK